MIYEEAGLTMCLSSAEVVFLFGIEATHTPALCTTVAALLHFFFLSSFAWMFLEGYQIYVLLVTVKRICQMI